MERVAVALRPPAQHKTSMRKSSAHGIRAVFLASATATTFGRLRSRRCIAHFLPGLLSCVTQDRSRSDNQQPSQIAIAPLAGFCAAVANCHALNKKP